MSRLASYLAGVTPPVLIVIKSATLEAVTASIYPQYVDANDVDNSVAKQHLRNADKEDKEVTGTEPESGGVVIQPCPSQLLLQELPHIQIH